MSSFNMEEENLLKKKYISLDAIRKQAVNSLTTDQKMVYKTFTKRIRRSELLYARLVGNNDRIKQLTNSICPSFNTTLNDEAGVAVIAILRKGVPWKEVTGLFKKDINRSYLSQTDRSDERNTKFDQKTGSVSQDESLDLTDFKTRKVTRRFYSASGDLPRGKEEVTVQAVRVDETTNENTKQEKNAKLVKKRPKTTYLPLGTRGRALKNDSPSITDKSIPKEIGLESRIKIFIEKLKAMQQLDADSRDYYAQRYDTTGRKQTPYLWEEEVGRSWLPVGKESNHQSMTLKKLDENITRNFTPLDILLMDQYNVIVTEENGTVRNWPNNNPYKTAKSIQNHGKLP